MNAVLSSQTIFTFQHDYRAFAAALEHGERCEIDEAMFVHWLETAPFVFTQHDVVLSEGLEVRADFVAQTSDGMRRLIAFWCRGDEANPTDRRYFAQRAVCLV